MLLSVAIIVFLICICVNMYKKINARALSSVPTVPVDFGIGLLFASSKVLMDKCIIIGEFTNKNGGISKIFYGPVIVYVITSPEEASIVLTQCMDKMFVYNLINSYVGKELVSATVPVWKRNRRIADLAFKQHIVDKYIDVFNRQASRLADLLIAEVGKEVDLVDVITRTVLEIVCQTTMGVKMDGKEVVTDAYAKAINKVLHIITERFKHPWLISDFLFRFSSYKREQDEALKVIWDLSNEMVALKKQIYIEKLRNKDVFNEKEEKCQSFLDILIENTVTEDNSLFSDIQLRQLVDNILLAGFDTTSVELIFALVCIGSYPEIQDRVYEEIINVVGEDRSITRRDLQNLTYLEAVIKEVLRLYPIGPVLARQADKEVHLNNHTIPASSAILVHVWSLNRNPVYWGQDANDFKPERWLNPHTVPEHPAAFASFSPGRRNCIGKAYGMMVMKTILAHIIRRYRVVGDHSCLELAVDVLLKPESGYLVTLELR